MRAWSKMLFGLGLAVAVAASLVIGRPAAAQDKGTIYYLAPTLFDEFQVETKNMDDAILQKPKAIILAAVDADAISPGIEKAHAAGIPILVYDRQITNRPVEFTSVAGTVEIGRLSAGEAVKLLTARNGAPKGKIL